MYFLKLLTILPVLLISSMATASQSNSYDLIAGKYAEIKLVDLPEGVSLSDFTPQQLQHSKSLLSFKFILPSAEKGLLTPTVLFIGREDKYPVSVEFPSKVVTYKKLRSGFETAIKFDKKEDDLIVSVGSYWVEKQPLNISGVDEVFVGSVHQRINQSSIPVQKFLDKKWVVVGSEKKDVRRILLIRFLD